MMRAESAGSGLPTDVANISAPSPYRLTLIPVRSSGRACTGSSCSVSPGLVAGGMAGGDGDARSGALFRLRYGKLFRLSKRELWEGSMADGATGRAGPGPRRRADARRNAEALLDAARSVFE